MSTQSDLPTLTLKLQLSARGDVLWHFWESSEERLEVTQGWPRGFEDPDDVWRVVRKIMAIEVATWIHRLRRSALIEDDDSPSIPGRLREG